MRVLLLGLFFLAIGFAVYTFSKAVKKRRGYLRAFGEKFGLAYRDAEMELTGELEGLEIHIHNALRGDRALEMGAPVHVSNAPMVVDVVVPGCPPTLRLQSTPPRMAGPGGASLAVAPHPDFERAFTASSVVEDDLAVLESDAVRAAFMAIASAPTYRGAFLEEGTLCVFHFSRALSAPGEAAELGRTVELALGAAAALRDVCAAR